MELNDFLAFVLPIFSLEVIAALAGTYYLKKSISKFSSTKYLVIFLWITVFVELIASYAPAAFFSDYKIFAFLEGTQFADNTWLYNIYNVLSFSFFILYFIYFLKNRKWKIVFTALTIIYIVVSVIIMVATGRFFESPQQFVTMTGTLLLFISVAFFYFELLRSDLLLQLKRFLPFYISVGVLVFNLCVAPVDILIQYFNIADGNELFVKLRLNVLLYSNIFMYATFIFGFLICSRKKKSSY